MKKEQIEAMEYFGNKGKQFGELGDRFFESAFFIHGHMCGGMPLGFRAGLAALKSLGAERELNMAKLVFVETGTGHAAGCFADGVQMASGCTFGKGLIQRTEYGKWALNLVEKGTRKAVRVSVRPEVIQAAFQSPFVKMRHDGVAPTEIPIDISRKLVENLLSKKDDELFTVSGVFEYPLPQSPPPTFNLVTCSMCGEVMAENKARLKDSQPVCIPCANKL
ncbi:MAG: formylmethanofuran dehydrogenase [Deltaproteobacteria bacterium]|nr:formylmethanofuran dehydrogenase [Deltaproteobacteria bacterium]